MGKGQADRERAQDRHDATCKGLKGLTLHPGPSSGINSASPSFLALNICIPPPLPTTSPRTLTPLSCPDQPIPPACLHDAFRCRRYDALTATRDGPLPPGTSVLIAAPVTAGTNPIHNKKAKKKVVEEDEDDKAFKAKMLAGGWSKCAVWNKGTI